MDYKMEELIPVVSRLAEKYTAFEDSSVTYEKAEQLMEAVLYCIRELERSDENLIAVGKELCSAQQAYETGYMYVKKRPERRWRCIMNF